jgi:hypothetical protein
MWCRRAVDKLVTQAKRIAAIDTQDSIVTQRE